MKRLIFLLLLCFLLQNSYCQNDNLFILKGEINPMFNNDTIMLFRFYNEGICGVDTTVIKNGSFTFQGKEYLRDFSLLSIGNYPDTVLALSVLLERGNIEASFEKKIAKGTPLNDLYNSYWDSTHVYNRKIGEQYALQEDRLVRHGSQLHQAYIDAGRFSVNFKKNNINNIVGQHLFESEFGGRFGEVFAYPAEDSIFSIIYEAAGEDYRNSPWVRRHLSKRDEIKKKEKERAARMEELIGKEIVDFEFITPDEESRKISDYFGTAKILVLDFWASWCGPCIADMPHLKKIYEKYHSQGVEIIGVSLDSSLKRWRQGLTKIDTPWIQLSDLKGNPSDLTRFYQIKGIPHCVILDGNGRILKMDVRSLTEEILDDLLKQD